MTTKLEVFPLNDRFLKNHWATFTTMIYKYEPNIHNVLNNNSKMKTILFRPEMS